MKEFQPCQAPTHLVYLLTAQASVLEAELLACLTMLGGRVLSHGEAPLVLAVPIAGVDSVDRIILTIEGCVAGLSEGECRDAMRGAEIRLTTLRKAEDVHGGGGAEKPEKLNGLNIVLETGRAFGSGYHPSTRLCLDALRDLSLRPEGFPESLLDVGCGSGILSLAGIRLGARAALGIDSCPETIEVARHNAELNGMRDLVHFSTNPLEGLTESFPLVVANLPASILLSLLPSLAARVGRPGTLILSGAGRTFMEDLSGFLEKSGFTRVHFRTSGDWAALVMRRR